MSRPRRAFVDTTPLPTAMYGLKPINGQQKTECEKNTSNKVNIRRSPNIKTNPNYIGSKKASPNPSLGSSDCEDFPGNVSRNRPRSLVVLGTSTTARKSRHSESDLLDDRGLITSDIDFDLSPKIPHHRYGLDSGIGLSSPELRQKYGKGLSSPYMGKSRKLQKKSKRSSSLDILQRSHECFKVDGKCTCNCTLRLYRSESAGELLKKKKSRKPKKCYTSDEFIKPQNDTPRSKSNGRLSRKDVVAPVKYNPASGKHNATNSSDPISEKQVSSFFQPSPTVWKTPVMGRNNSRERAVQNQNNTDMTDRSGAPNVQKLEKPNGYKEKKFGLFGDIKLVAKGPKERSSDPELDKQHQAASEYVMTHSNIITRDDSLDKSDSELDQEISPRTTHKYADTEESTQFPEVENKITDCNSSITTTPSTECMSNEATEEDDPKPVGPTKSSGDLKPSERHRVPGFRYEDESDKERVKTLIERYANFGSLSYVGLSRDDLCTYLDNVKERLGLMQAQNKIEEENSKPEDPPVKNISSMSEDIEEMIVPVSQPLLNGREKAQSTQVEVVEELIVPVSQPLLQDQTQPQSQDTNIPAVRATGTAPNKPKRQESTEKATPEKSKLIEKEDIDILKQTTFHVDGAITNSPSIRRRVWIDGAPRDKPCSNADDDENNNDGTSAALENGIEYDESKIWNGIRSGDVLYSRSFPAYTLWSIRGAFDETETVPKDLLELGLDTERYRLVIPFINECVKYKQLASTLDTWLNGCYFAAIFLLLWLLGFIVCFLGDISARIAPGFLFVIAVFLILGVAAVFQITRKQLECRSQTTLLGVNRVLCYNDMFVVVSSQGHSLGHSVNFVFFDCLPCQKLLMLSIRDKGSENYLLTQITELHPDLMSVITQDLEGIATRPATIGRKIILRDILLYFAPSFLETFMKKSRQTGKGFCRGSYQGPAFEFCSFIRAQGLNKAFKDLSGKVLPETISHTKRCASKPTCL